jgi:hypothetical protein
MIKLVNILKKVLLENQAIVDKILDKISISGMESLSSREKEYLIKYSKGEKDLAEPISGETKVYAQIPTGELYKIENFPALPNAESVNFECDDTSNQETCEGYLEMINLLKNEDFKYIINKIHKNSPFSSDNVYFHAVNFDGDFSSPIDIAYAQVAGDGVLYFVDSLDQFSNGYQSEEGWRVKKWKQL